MIYVVDDTADYRFLVQHVFKRFLPQYPLRLFADGLDLMQFIDRAANSSLADGTKADQTLPGLLVLDVDMPKLNGFQTLEQLKQYPSWQSVPVVMMSSREESKFLQTALQEGAISYVVKPMYLAELQQVMTQLCHQYLDG